MADGIPKINQKGFKVFVETVIDVSTASTELSIRFTKPDGITVGSWTAIAETVDGKVGCSYVTANISDIAEPGNWTFQVYAKAPSYELYGNKVKQKFKDPMAGF